MEKDFEAGEVILIDKPQNWTSFDVVNKLRFALKVKKIGHAGTLDPLATGLLILCSGKWTKKIDEYQAQEKEYIGEMTFGHTTPSFDSETEPDNTFEYTHLTQNLLIEATNQFKGVISQKPPIYSAIKIDGKRLYDLARKGKSIDIPDRQVEIKAFELTKIELPKVEFRVICSKGTYIRSLANDFGKAVNSGAYMSALRRTRIGEFSVENALSVEEFVKTYGIRMPTIPE
jgi:tRNA pseudouridine55 synthase